MVCKNYAKNVPWHKSFEADGYFAYPTFFFAYWHIWLNIGYKLYDINTPLGFTQVPQSLKGSILYPGLRYSTHDSTGTVERCPFSTFLVERCPISTLWVKRCPFSALFNLLDIVRFCSTLLDFVWLYRTLFDFVRLYRTLFDSVRFYQKFSAFTGN